MPDRILLPLFALTAAAMIALAAIWPQGLGDRSPRPFGHMPVQRTPEMRAAMQRETAAAVAQQQRDKEAAAAAETGSSQPAPGKSPAAKPPKQKGPVIDPTAQLP